MPNSPLKILIVEDRENAARVIAQVLEPMKERFPLATITIVSTLAKALEIINSDPPPDVVTLDLMLPDSDLPNTIAHLEAIESRSPVVIVTGGNLEAHREILEKLHVEVIQKDGGWLSNNRFIMAIANALTRGSQRQRERIEARANAIDRLKEEYGPAINAA